jgi:CheY-like chemotaxis protein
MQALKTVLVIEDDAAVRDGVIELLQASGFDAQSAPNGSVALERLRAGLRPCVILLDVIMPTMDGWDFRQEQLKDASLKDIPTIVTTASGFSKGTIEAQFGAVHVLAKPPSPSELVELVRQLANATRPG